MAKQINTSIQINASRETVWQVLTDFKKYAEWNTFIHSITGEVKVGNRIIVKLLNMTFKPTVLVYTKATELKWVGRFGFKGVFDGEHRFHLTENGDGTVHFEQSEIFTGILVKLFSKSLNGKTKQGFEQMNRELKTRAENYIK
jgi:hypothetical protein